MGGRCLRALGRAGLLLAASIVLAACGHSSSGGKLSRQSSLIGGSEAQGQSAGQSPPYSPSGTVIADDGFRPDRDGFAFENYGNSVGPQNMTAVEMHDLFGDQVCASGSGSSCQLTPVAQEWMDTENKRMDGGHCFGFSLASLLFYKGALKGSAFGKDKTFALPIVGNTPLQSRIAEEWVFQDLAPVKDRQIKGTPSEILDKLISTLKDRSGEVFTIAIFKADGTGGHAITPFAVEDNGGGKFHLLVYDNNFPGVTRAVSLDRNANTWSYTGGINPSDTTELYQGDAGTKSLSLYPSSPAASGPQPCPFCSGGGSSAAGTSTTGSSTAAGASTTGSAPTVSAAAGPAYNEVTLTGNPSNHSHLLILDAEGHRTGLIGGHQINEVPGVQVVTTISDRNWAEAPEPTYRVPVKTPFIVKIDGAPLKRPDTEKVDVIGPGDYVSVDEIKMAPGQRDKLTFFADGSGFIYNSGGKQDETPILTAAVDTPTAEYGFAVKALGVRGAKLNFNLDTKNGELDLGTMGTKGGIGGTGYGVYIFSETRQRHGESHIQTFINPKLLIKSGELGVLDYSHFKAGKEPRLLIGGPDGSNPRFETLKEDRSGPAGAGNSGGATSTP